MLLPNYDYDLDVGKCYKLLNWNRFDLLFSSFLYVFNCDCDLSWPSIDSLLSGPSIECLLGCVSDD